MEVGLAAPPALANGPELWPGNEEYLKAFLELSAGREWIVGMGVSSPMPISARARMDIATERRIGVDSLEYEEFGEHMKALDAEWMAQRAKGQKKK